MVRSEAVLFFFAGIGGAIAVAQPSLDIPTSVVAVDASSPAAVFAASGSGGLLRSTDSGFSWRALHINPAGQPQPILFDIATDPVNARTVYVATDTADGGVWKSTDAGETWTKANAGLPREGVQVFILRILPSAPQTIYAVAGEEVYKTTNGGESWSLLGKLPSSTTAFAVHPANPSLMFAAQGPLIHKSTNEGASWTGARNPLPLAAGTVVVALATDARDTNVVWAAARGQGSGNGIYRSRDQALAFQRVLLSQPVDLITDPAGRPFVYSSSVESMCLDRSLTQGASWEKLCLGDGSGGAVFAVDPQNPNVLWAGTLRGPFTSSNVGTTWSSRFGSVKPTLSTPASPLNFQLAPGTPGSLEIGLRVVETSRWTVPITVAGSNERWLAISGAASTTPANLVIRVNPAGLEPGEYTGSIRISSPQVINDPVVLPVRLKVAAAPLVRPYVMQTWVGIGQRGSFGDGGMASRAAIGNPDSVTVDNAGNLYVSDPGNHVVRRVTRQGIISRYAGNGQYGLTGNDGPADLASLRNPRGLAADGSGTLYLAEADVERMRRVTTDGAIRDFARVLEGVRGVAADEGGTVYATVPRLHIVVRIPPQGQPEVFAGTGAAGFRGDGFSSRFARLSAPNDVAVDRRGNVYIADTENHRIRMVAPDGVIRTIAGNGLPGFQGDSDAAGTVALLRPQGLAADADGTVFVADSDNHRVRMISNGAMQTIAGGAPGDRGDNGPAVNAQLRSPSDVAVDPSGTLYVADTFNFRVRRMTPPPPPPPPPQISMTDGVVNGGDETPRFAPGGLFRVRGTDLASTTSTSPDASWPIVSGGTTVMIGGVAAPLGLVSPAEIRGQIPFDVAPGQAALKVTAGGQVSREVMIEISATAPAIVLSQPGRAFALTAGGSPIGDDNAAVAGSEITVFLTGQGLVDPAVASGTAPPAAPPSIPTASWSATLNEAEVEVTSVSLVPGFVGLARAGLKLPASLVSGDYPITITIGGAASNAAAIRVKEAEPAEPQ